MTSVEKTPARDRLEQHLLEAGLPVDVRRMPASTRTAAEAAAALGCDIGAIASSLVFLADGAPILVMTSGRHRVDTAVVAAFLGATTVEMAPAKLVRQVTGQPIGGVAPVGHPAPLRTLVDETLRSFDPVWTAAGATDAVMPLRFDDLVRLTHGTVAAVA